MTPLFDRFAEVAAQFASKTALIFKDKRISYALLFERVLSKAAELEAAWGLGSGVRIAYVGLNDPEQVVTLLACAKVGAIFLPINYRLADAEIAQIKEDSSLGDACAGACLLVYTSGTTGQPKGAVHTQAALLANARAAWAAHEMTCDDVILSTLPMFHVGGLCIQTLPALLIGATVVLHDRFDPSAWLAAVARYQPTLSLVVPATMKAIQESPAWSSTDLSSLRGVMAGSSTIPRHLIDAFHARGVPVGQIYGTTETGPVSAVLPFAKAISHAGYAGWPHAECTIELHNQNEEGVGEVVIKASNLMAGYWNEFNWGQPLINSTRFNTCDLGRIHEDGCLEIVGRAKDMLISGGENIYPAEIENALLAHPSIEECAVIGVPDEAWGEIPVAYVVWKQTSDNASQALSDAALLDFLKTKIAKFKLPKRFVTMAALPKSALGKVLKAELKSTHKI
jgi:fatty-acyl-CoA synthase